MKRRRHLFRGNVLWIWCSAIFFLCGAGISYAHFQNQITISAHLGTGELSLVYLNEYSVHPQKGIENTEFHVTNDRLYFKADMEEGYKGSLTYKVKNTGTLPVEIEDEIIKPQESKELMVKIHPSFRSKVLSYKQWENP